MTTRAEHLDWCKQRALDYVDRGELGYALASLHSDLGKHEETERHPAGVRGHQLFLAGHLDTPEQMREWIERVQ